MEKLINVLVIAGYGQDADKLRSHRNFIEFSTLFGIEQDVDLFFSVGGATNPDFPESTEADASMRVIQEKITHYRVVSFSKINSVDLLKIRQENIDVVNQFIESKTGLSPILPVVVLRTGNTSADTLDAVKNFIQKNKISIDTLILACEISRSTGFLMDSLFVGLSQLAKRIIVYTESFPETPEEFENQKKKLLGKLLSHRYKLFHWIRYVLQKRHQRRVAKIKRSLNKS